LDSKDGLTEHGRAMPSVKVHALKILTEYDEARSKLIGKAVVLTDGKAGTVENVWLDELHGLRISIKKRTGALTRAYLRRIRCLRPNVLDLDGRVISAKTFNPTF
jgi:hypothetical protein